jgi:3-hydroxybutyrate dehydrogenase
LIEKGSALEKGKLVHKTALVTGASKGIGRAIAECFASEGASVALVARTLADLEQLAQDMQASGAEARPFVCDVTDRERVRQLPAEVERELGPIDILVNNAGAAVSHKFLEHPDELWHLMLEVNLTGTYLITKAVAPGMVGRKWGRIINLASVASKVGASYVTAYTASKHGVLGLTRALAVELNPHGITVNAICPGYVDTPMTDAAVANIVARTGRTEKEARGILEETNPQKRLIAPEEVARVAVMLAEENSRGITGQAINVDGGAVMF